MIDLQERFIERRSFIFRLFIVYLMFGFLFLIILYQVFQLQVSNYSDYEIAALENKTHEMNIQPVRGIIYDRHGTILVKNIPTFNLIAIPNKIDDPEFFITQIKSFIEITEEAFKNIRHPIPGRTHIKFEPFLFKLTSSPAQLGIFLKHFYNTPSLR